MGDESVGSVDVVDVDAARDEDVFEVTGHARAGAERLRRVRGRRALAQAIGVRGAGGDQRRDYEPGDYARKH